MSLLDCQFFAGSAGETPNAAYFLFLGPEGRKKIAATTPKTGWSRVSPLRGCKKHAALGETPALPAKADVTRMT